MLLMSIALTACLSEIPTKPRPDEKPPIETDADTDSDSDSDSDADSDTDTDPVDDEDCGNGLDDDQDGLVDCEDEDCVDVCIEDCDNDADDDADGDVDCADDECVGAPECEHVWTVTSSISEGQAWVGYGPDIDEWAGYEAVGWLSGQIVLEAANGRGESFECHGLVDAGPPVWGEDGMSPTSASCGGCDWSFEFEPRVDQGSLEWKGSCPVASLPMLQVGFRSGKGKITADMPSGWVNQYTGGDYGWGFEDDHYDLKWGVIYELESKSDRSWTSDAY